MVGSDRFAITQNLVLFFSLISRLFKKLNQTSRFNQTLNQYDKNEKKKSVKSGIEPNFFSSTVLVFKTMHINQTEAVLFSPCISFLCFIFSPHSSISKYNVYIILAKARECQCGWIWTLHVEWLWVRKRTHWLQDMILSLCQGHDCLGKEVRYASNMDTQALTKSEIVTS